MQNTVPAAMGVITICGIVVNHHYVILGTSIAVLFTCAVVLIQMIRNCRARSKRLENLKNRRSKPYANTRS